MKDYLKLQIANFVDQGGQFELIKSKTTITHNNKEYRYIATGLARDVFVSEDGKWVIKVPKNFYPWGFSHNALEVEAYNEAPVWCKKHIAESYLTEEGYVLQEYLNVHYIGDAYWRELGYREDGTQVIFDCDIFLNSNFEKPKSGFKYQEVFSKLKSFDDAYIEANEIPKRQRVLQKAAREKHFPGCKKVSTSGGYGGQKCFIGDVQIPLELALECGFISEIYED